MKISQLQLNNVRSFVGPKDNPIVEINFSETINVIIGANNSGKSTIMNTLHSMQNSAIINKSYIRSGLPNCVYYIHFLKIDKRKFKQKGEILKKGHLTFALKEGQNLVTSLIIEGEGVLILDQPLSPLPEPENLIYPFTAERKEIRGFEEKFNEQTAFNVLPNLTNLYAKISHLSQSGHKRNAIFTEYCKDLLGFIITAVPSGQGQKASLYIDNQKSIPIDSMGDGVTQILGLLVSLCVAKDQIFLIEELENDLHPIALKKLLDLILLKSPENQFIISTHSHIVLNHLGSDPKTKIIETKMSLDENSIPLTAIREVKEPADRIKVLEDLGYSLSDYSLWEGWLILEESSAEKVIREFLIPNFAPKLLGKIRTIGAKGDSDAETHFMNYERLFLYAHL
ncbi:MAG: AAA family ATPase, partial [Leptospira sp.]|nr:AAA family ATPase [Leptospira sp.]